MCSCFVLIATSCGRVHDPSGVSASLIKLPSGDQWTETVDFNANGTCYYGHAPTIALCQWSRRGNTITISRNRVVLNELQYDGKQLVDPQTALVRGRYVQQR
jgi:hypothetical protein